MTGDELRALLVDLTGRLEDGADELRRLDAAVGDGDLGVTVRSAAAAVRDATEPHAGASVAELTRLAGQAVAQANPSTMGALLGAGLLRAAREVADDPVDLAGGARAARAAHDTIAARGKAERGDKTILDALGPAVEALEAAAERGDDADRALDDAVDAARRGVEETTPLVSRKGRARWVGERAQGEPDPGAVLCLRILEAWRASSGT